MAKARTSTLYLCSHCGAKSHKWVGQCSGCGSWNTLDLMKATGSSTGLSSDSVAPVRLADVVTGNFERYQTGLSELDRVLGALDIIASRFDVIVSLDTSSPEVITAGAAAGAGMINDVRALTRDGALAAASSSALPVCIMHMRGEPGTMQQAPQYYDVVAEVSAFLQQRGAVCEAAGIAPQQLIYDPGFGFGKTPSHNFSLLRHLPDIVALGRPVLTGLSRKSMIASVLERDTSQRLPASLALAVLAVVGGASILRVHDVAETVDAVAMVTAWAEASL